LGFRYYKSEEGDWGSGRKKEIDLESDGGKAERKEIGIRRKLRVGREGVQKKY